VARLKSATYQETGIVGLVTLLLGFIHPYDLVIIYIITGVWLLVTAIREKQRLWPQFFKLSLIYSISSVALIYFVLLRHFDPTFAGWAHQNITWSPNIVNYMVSFGLIFIFFLLGILPAAKSDNRYNNFLAVWVTMSWILLYLPMLIQLKLGNGMYIPMVLTGVLGAMWLIKKISHYPLLKQRWLNRLLILIVIVLLVGSNFISLFVDYVFINPLGIDLYYLTPNEIKAFSFIKEHLNSHDIILSSYGIGSLLAALTGRYVYFGHAHQTRNFIIKKYDVEQWFFRYNTNDQRKRQWLHQQGINYLYFGKREKDLGDFDPQEKDYLKPVFQNNEAIIYQVL